MNTNLIINGEYPTGVYINGQPVIKILINGFKVWPRDIEPDDPIIEIMSCFASGYWIDSLPWSDDDIWVD